MGIAGFILGTVAGQFAGAWIYGRIHGPELLAASAGGIVTTIVASLIYIPFGVHTWLGGEGTSWGASVFLGFCMGICQVLLFRGPPLRRQPSPPTRSE